MAVPTATNLNQTVSNRGASLLHLIGADTDGTALVFSIVAQPSHGTLSGLIAATGYVVYTPNAGYVGPDSFTFKVTSGGEDSTTATATLAVTNAKTRVVGQMNVDHVPYRGKVSFFLLHAAESEGGLILAEASVSAVIAEDGSFQADLYPSASLFPESYYSAWFVDENNVRQEFLGLYNVPASSTNVTLSTIRVLDAAKLARFTFISYSDLQTVAGSITEQVSALLGVTFAGATRVAQRLQKWNGTTVVDAGITDDGTTIQLLTDTQHKGSKLGLYGEDPVTRLTLKTSSGLSGALLEHEMNKMKYAFRHYGLSPKSQLLTGVAAPANTLFPVWFKAGSITGLSDNADVTSWPSIGNGGSAATPGSSPNKPKYVANALNGKPGVKFNGTDGWLEFTRVSGLRTLIIVFAHATGTSSSNYQTLIGDTVAYSWTGGQNDGLLIGGGLGDSSLCRINGAGQGFAIYQKKKTTYQVLTLQASAGFDFNLIGSDRKAAGRTWNGTICEIMGSTSILTAAQQGAAENYLFSEYGIPPVTQIFFDGNSLTAGQGATTGHDYVSVCLNLLGPSFAGVNYGVGGQDTQDMIADAVTQIDSQRVAGSKQIVVAWEGTNDIYSNGVTATQCYNNLVSYCTARRAAGFPVIVLPIAPRSNSGTPGDFETKRVAVNANLAANWRSFADGYADFTLDPRLGVPGAETNSLYYYDLVHQTDLGQAAVAEWATYAILSI